MLDKKIICENFRAFLPLRLSQWKKSGAKKKVLDHYKPASEGKNLRLEKFANQKLKKKIKTHLNCVCVRIV